MDFEKMALDEVGARQGGDQSGCAAGMKVPTRRFRPTPPVD